MASESVIYVPPAAVPFWVDGELFVEGSCIFSLRIIGSRGHSVRREDGDVRAFVQSSTDNAVIFQRL